MAILSPTRTDTTTDDVLLFLEMHQRRNMTESILLGNVAMRVGGKFKWNAKKLSTDRKDANEFISKAYRSQWGFKSV